MSVRFEKEVEEQTQKRIVEIRVIFFKIGEIDTLNEKFYAEAYIEASWSDCININSTYDPKIHWNPDISILNYFGDLKEQKWYVQYELEDDLYLDNNNNNNNDCHKSSSFQIDNNNNNKRFIIYERRRIQGQFWQILDLKHFPIDVQYLTLCITTSKHTSELLLIRHSIDKTSSVNVNCFSDHQEWHLYKHIKFNEFKRDSVFSQDKQYSCINITLCVARRPAFYYWNAFFLIFLITLSSLAIFSIECSLPQNRIQIACTLLLTSVSFKWITNRSLPTISYMTSLDKYSLACILIIVLQGVWHGTIGSLTLASHGKCVDFYESCDLLIFTLIVFLFVLLHLVCFLWLYKIGYAKRRELNKNEQDYTNSLLGKRVARLQSMVCGV